MGMPHLSRRNHNSGRPASDLPLEPWDDPFAIWRPKGGKGGKVKITARPHHQLTRRAWRNF
jgi:hypothetical protein